MPLIVFEFVKLISLPINCIDAFIQRICYCGNLEWEYIIFQFIIGFSDGIRLSVQEKCLIRELTMETTDY